jgi:hypothetical protein
MDDMRGPGWRFLGVALVVAMLLGAAPAVAQRGAVQVRGYTRKDGTYVAPHMRSAPDGTTSNNWSTKGNVNPYTGQAGTKSEAGTAASNGIASPTISRGDSISTTDTVGARRPPAAAPETGAALSSIILEPPKEVVKRYGWQITSSIPPRTLLAALRAPRPGGIACKQSGLWGPCRLINQAHPIGKDETWVERAVFFGAVNRVSDKVEVFGYPTIADCNDRAGAIANLYTADYKPLFGCEVISAENLGPPGAAPALNTTDPPVLNATREQPGLPPRAAASLTDDQLAAKLAAQQDKHARVCGIIQHLGSRIDGLTTDEAAAIIQEAIPAFAAEDFQKIAVNYGVVRCFEPHTRTFDNCTNGDILRFRKGRRCR